MGKKDEKSIKGIDDRNKDLCLKCTHYWEDFPLPLENVVSHCDIVDKKYNFKGMNQYITYPCLECPFNQFSPINSEKP